MNGHISQMLHIILLSENKAAEDFYLKTVAGFEHKTAKASVNVDYSAVTMAKIG